MLVKKSLTIAVSAVVTAAIMLTGCGSTATQKTADKKDVIRIGVYEPLTGASASGGQMSLEGIKIANKYYPEVLGKKVELVVVDNKSEKQEAANAVERLVKDKVDVILGSYGSSLSMAGGPIARDAGIPVIGDSPTNPAVTIGNDYYSRVCFIDTFQGLVMANFAVDNLKAKKVAIIRDVQQDMSVAISNYFEKQLVKRTGDANAIVTVVNFNTGDKDFSAQLTEVKSKNPDVIFAPVYFLEAGILVQKAREMGINVPILGCDAWEAEEFLNLAGKYKDIYFSTHFTAEQPITEVSSFFLEKYKAEYPNQQVNAFAALGFDAYMLALDAITRAGSTDHKAIRDAIAGTKNFKGATGIITLDANRDASKTAIIKQVKDGKFAYLTKVEPQ